MHLTGHCSLTLLLITAVASVSCASVQHSAEDRILALESEIKELKALINEMKGSLSLRDRKWNDASSTDDNGDLVHKFETFSDTQPPVPPLDSPIVWTRQHDEDGTIGTHQTLSIIQKETASHSFPWPVYIQLETEHNEGDAVGIYIRKNSTAGTGWSAAYHTDLYNTAAYRGTTIGANIEIVNPAKPLARAIGINVLARNDNGGLGGDAALNIQNGFWDHGIHFDVNSNGETALKVDGTWGAGLDLKGNSLLMAGGKVVLGEQSTEEVSLRYDSSNKRVVLLLGDRVLWEVKT